MCVSAECLRPYTRSVLITDDNLSENDDDEIDLDEMINRDVLASSATNLHARLCCDKLLTYVTRLLLDHSVALLCRRCITLMPVCL